MLRGRKVPQYAIWRKAVVVWIGNDLTRRMTPDEWGPFGQWKADLEATKRYVPSVSARDDFVTGAGWQAYLAGLSTAEGCFLVQRNGSPRFAIHLRADDAQLLRGLRNLSGLGRVYGPYARREGDRNPSVRWQVFSTRDAELLVDLFERFPPGGRKMLDFSIWKHAVFERLAGPSWNRTRVDRVRTELVELRQYSGRYRT